MKSSNSLSIPWKWFSTKRVTVPPYFPHTIISWVCAPPPHPELWPCSPYSRGSRSGVVVCQCQWVLPSLTCLKGLLSPLLREGLTIAACSDQSWVELAPSHWGRWMLLLFSKSRPKSLFIFLQDSLLVQRLNAESDLENCIFLESSHMF